MAADIGLWLREQGLEQYAQAFRDNAIDEEILPKLTADDLKDLGVTLVGHRRKLLAAIAGLREAASGSPLPPSSEMRRREGRRTSTRGGGSVERRHLTLMFCDLVGSTSLASRLDPEDLRDLIGAYHRAVEQEVLRFGGLVARYMGDGVMIYFGYPLAQEDDPERAVRAGLALTERIAAMETPMPLVARVGIATGLVVVGDLIASGDEMERDVVGETPNLAAPPTRYSSAKLRTV